MLIAGAVTAFLGVIFSLQGFGVLEGSGMSNTTTWSILGPIIAVIGLAIAWRGAGRRS
jgi:hypothetical protein